MAELDRFDEERAMYDGELISIAESTGGTAHTNAPKRLVLVVGESGSGKDTVVKDAVQRYGYHQALSCTTRAPRCSGEDTHLFVTDEEFEELRPQMVASTEFDGNKYGCTYDELNRSDFFVVDVKGAQDVLEAAKQGHISRVVKIAYLFAYEDLRLRRMIARGDSIETAMRRIKHDEQKFKHVAMLEPEIIFNCGNIDDAVHALVSLLCMQEEITTEPEAEELPCLYANGSPLELRL